MADGQTIIIKRVKKGGGHPHHGGAWKVAYADFVTAMMAFFLMMWLLSSTTDAQKQGISEYFTPVSVSLSSGGAGGMLGGLAISSPGAMSSRTSVPSVSLNIEPTQGASEGDADGGSEDAALDGKTDPEGSGPAAGEQEETKAVETGKDLADSKPSAKRKAAATK